MTEKRRAQIEVLTDEERAIVDKCGGIVAKLDRMQAQARNRIERALFVLSDQHHPVNRVKAAEEILRGE